MPGLVNYVTKSGVNKDDPRDTHTRQGVCMFPPPGNGFGSVSGSGRAKAFHDVPIDGWKMACGPPIDTSDAGAAINTINTLLLAGKTANLVGAASCFFFASSRRAESYLVL